MKRAMALLVAGLALNCGDKDFECDIEQATGVYLVEYSEMSGSCGDLPDVLVNLSDSSLGEDCVVSTSSVSEDGCTIEESGTCDSSADDVRLSITVVVEQENESLSSVSGISTVTATTLSTGASICLGTYDIKATKQ